MFHSDLIIFDLLIENEFLVAMFEISLFVQYYTVLYKWSCLVEGFNTLATADVLNLPDK